MVEGDVTDSSPRFGRVMLENLLARGCQLSGAAACRDQESQVRGDLVGGAPYLRDCPSMVFAP